MSSVPDMYSRHRMNVNQNRRAITSLTTLTPEDPDDTMIEVPRWVQGGDDLHFQSIVDEFEGVEYLGEDGRTGEDGRRTRLFSQRDKDILKILEDVLSNVQRITPYTYVDAQRMTNIKTSMGEITEILDRHQELLNEERENEE